MTDKEIEVEVCPLGGNFQTEETNLANLLKNCHMASCTDDSWICAICLNKIELEQTSQIKGCEHAYCLPCILQWSTFKEVPWCPQCRKTFSSLYSYRNLDGSYVDYMVEESVCLLVRAKWFKPKFEIEEETEDYFEEDYYDEDYFHPTVNIGNRRWGENGFVSGGRIVARPRTVQGSSSSSSSSSSTSTSLRNNDSNNTGKEKMGRRAKRNLKRENRKQGASNQT